MVNQALYYGNQTMKTGENTVVLGVSFNSVYNPLKKIAALCWVEIFSVSLNHLATLSIRNRKQRFY